jgi:hypothetical protein
MLCLLPTLVNATDHSEDVHSKTDGLHSGITVRFDPPGVQPGDVCDLIVQMDREAFSQFDLHVPSHPQLHLVAVERTPISFAGGRYRQRHRLRLQPLSSGKVTIDNAEVEFTDSNGTQKFLLPAAILDVFPFESVDLSDVPQPWPVAGNPTATAPKSIADGLIIICGILLIVVAILWRIRLRTSFAERDLGSDPMCEAIERLESGTVPMQLLEHILDQRSYDLSPDLRHEIEQTVYNNRREPALLLDRLRKEAVQ